MTSFGRWSFIRAMSLFVAGMALGHATVDPAKAEAPASQPACEKKAEGEKKPKNYYVASKAASCTPENDKNGDAYLLHPYYVKSIDNLAPGLEDMKWLDFGLEQRTRFEYRDDDYRKPRFDNDQPFLMRTRGYLGIHDILDPFRAVVEFQDSRIFNSKFPDNNNDVDENEIFQLYGELFFKDALGENEPIRLRYGRMTIDEGDRMLVNRNAFPNAVNSFEGFRLTFGEASSLWEVDTIFVQPVNRRVHQFNHADEERWLYGIVSDWRGWSPWLILEPYYYILDEDHEQFKGKNPNDREIHTLGLRAYGVLKCGFDYDTDVMFQFGHDGKQDQRAFALHNEVGYTFQHDWKPRVALVAAYADGDRSSTDGVAERFDRMFGTSDWLSSINYYSLQNLIRTQLKFQLQPHKQVKLEAYYMDTWLAHNADGWVQVNRKDPTGSAGTFVGQELEARIRWQIDPRIELALGYIHFLPGGFARASGKADDSDFFYAQTTMQLYK